MPPVGFEFRFSTDERPQTDALDRAANGPTFESILLIFIIKLIYFILFIALLYFMVLIYFQNLSINIFDVPPEYGSNS
jgi:hypothetical protein